MRPTIRRSTLATLCLLSLGGLAACGDDDDETTTETTLGTEEHDQQNREDYADTARSILGTAIPEDMTDADLDALAQELCDIADNEGVITDAAMNTWGATLQEAAVFETLTRATWCPEPDD